MIRKIWKVRKGFYFVLQIVPLTKHLNQVVFPKHQNYLEELGPASDVIACYFLPVLSEAMAS